jgi:hypothetical protein
MGFFDKIFGIKSEKIIHSRYTPELLIGAYDKMVLRENDNTTGILSVFDDDIEVYFNIPKKNANTLMKDFFPFLFLIDAIVQKEEIDEYNIAYFDISEGKITIGYWGNKENTNFDVLVYCDAGDWYCSKIGVKEYNPPLHIS